MAGPRDSIKLCPRCGVANNPNAFQCVQCAHQFRTPPPNSNQPQYQYHSPHAGQQTQFGYVPKTSGGEGFAITSMILGIVSLVLFCAWFICFPCGLLGIIFGYLGLDSRHRGMAVAGMTCSIIALAFWAIWFFAIAAALASVPPAR